MYLATKVLLLINWVLYVALGIPIVTRVDGPNTLVDNVVEGLIRISHATAPTTKMAAKSELVDRTCTSPVLPNPRNGNTQLVSIQQQSLTMTRVRLFFVTSVPLVLSPLTNYHIPQNGPATPRPVETTASFKVSDVHGNPIHAFVTPVSDLAPTAPLEQPRIVLQDNVIQSMVQLELEEVENEIKFSGNCPTVPASTVWKR
ncbi:hypothetical protein V8F06_010997 [Rhypophila decipiens]